MVRKNAKKRSGGAQAAEDRIVNRLTKLALAQAAGSSKKKKTRAKNKPASNVTGFGNMLRSGGGAMGSLIGGFVPGGSEIGRKHGAHLGGLLSKFLGQGDYQVAQNSVLAGQIPGMHSNVQKVRVTHKEYIADVITGGANSFASAIYAINPGQSATFPWLSIIAQNFQEYSLKGLVFEFKSTSATGIASTTNVAMGSVIMATQYKANAAPFNNKQNMLEEYFSSDGRNYEDFCHPVECNPKENPYNVQYVRVGAVPSGEDVKTYDLGYFTIATSGFPGSNQVIGELWATYDVELLKPQLIQGLNAGTAYLHVWSSSNITAANPWGSPFVVVGNTGNASVSATTITFAQGVLDGNYMFILKWGTTVASFGAELVSYVTSSSTGVTALNALGGNGGTNISSVETFGATGSLGTNPNYFGSYSTFTVQPSPGVAPQFTVAAGVATNINSGELWMVQIPSANF
jgi:hypothetical protein